MWKDVLLPSLEGFGLEPNPQLHFIPNRTLLVPFGGMLGTFDRAMVPWRDPCASLIWRRSESKTVRSRLGTQIQPSDHDIVASHIRSVT